MKPPETITLIDLEGKPIYELTTPKSCFYTPVEELIATSMYNNVGYRESNPAKLINFLNDQLTFIRNGMWETLAIYQATLGRFWEVPSYSFCHEGYSYELPVFNSDKRVRLIGKMLTSGKIVHQPTLSDFIQHYPDVFSKLTPLEGTANQ
jgi:hypothetical protein